MFLTFGRCIMTKICATEDTGFTILGVICRNYFGFLNQRPTGLAVPEECLICEKMLQCMAAESKAEIARVETKAEFRDVGKTEPIIIIEEISENFEKPKTVTRQVENEE